MAERRKVNTIPSVERRNSMTDAERILMAMNDGFGQVHDRLNTIIGETATRQINCAARFSTIEKDMGIRNAVNGEAAKAKRLRVDFQSFLVRGFLLSMSVGIGVIIWKIFLGHIDLIVKG